VVAGGPDLWTPWTPLTSYVLASMTAINCSFIFGHDVNDSKMSDHSSVRRSLIRFISLYEKIKLM